MRWISSGASESKTSPSRLSGTSSGLKSNFPVILWRFLNFFEATSGSVVPILRKLNPCEFKNPRYQFTFTMCGLPGSLTTQFTCWRSNLKKSCLVSPDSKHRKSWTKIEMETQSNTFNRFWNIASVSDSNEFQRWANYYYFILLLLIFFHLENIITKISLVNERPYKMAKPASLYPGYQRFFFPRVWLDVSVSATGRQIFGQRPVDLTSHNLKNCLTLETAHEKSLGPTVENAIKMWKTTVWMREFKGAFDWPYSRQEPERLLQFPEYVCVLRKKILQRLTYPIQGRYSRFVFQVIYNSDHARKIK